MTFGSPVVLATLFLEDDDLIALLLFQHFSGDTCAVDQRCADRQALAVVHCQDFAQLDSGAGIAVQFFDGKNIVFRNAVLFSAGFDHCVHYFFRLSFPCSGQPARPTRQV